jgi:hypothetical protein
VRSPGCPGRVFWIIPDHSQSVRLPFTDGYPNPSLFENHPLSKITHSLCVHFICVPTVSRFVWDLRISKSTQSTNYFCLKSSTATNLAVSVCLSVTLESIAFLSLFGNARLARLSFRCDSSGIAFVFSRHWMNEQFALPHCGTTTWQAALPRSWIMVEEKAAASAKAVPGVRQRLPGCTSCGMFA